MPKIADARILIMATDGFEESELFAPRAILADRGAEVRLASPSMTPIQATVRDDPGRTIKPDLTIAEATLDDFDALVLPGGVINPDALRTDRAAVAAICERVATSYGVKKAQRQMGMTFRDGRLPSIAEWEEAADRLKIAAIKLTSQA